MIEKLQNILFSSKPESKDHEKKLTVKQEIEKLEDIKKNLEKEKKLTGYLLSFFSIITTLAMLSISPGNFISDQFPPAHEGDTVYNKYGRATILDSSSSLFYNIARVSIPGIGMIALVASLVSVIMTERETEKKIYQLKESSSKIKSKSKIHQLEDDQQQSKPIQNIDPFDDRQERPHPSPLKYRYTAPSTDNQGQHRPLSSRRSKASDVTAK